MAVPLAVLLALAQTTLGRNLALLGVYPNLLLLFATSWVLLRGLSEGLLIGLVGGILLDISSAAPFGAAILSLSVGISLAAIGEVNVFQGAWLLKYLVIAGATLLLNLVFLLVLRLAGYNTSLGLSLGRVILPELLVHVALMPVVYGFVKWLCKRMEPPMVEF
ncbi:MAG: rod shape-determining protein MreD [Anaerolineae bacterium]